MIKCLAVLQCLITWCVLLNSIYEYIVANLNRSWPLMVLWYEVDFVWAGLFFYYYGLFFHNLSGTLFLNAKKRLFQIFSALITLCGVVPFLVSSSPQAIRACLDWESGMILVPSGLVVILYATLLAVIRYKKQSNVMVRRIIRIDLRLKMILVPMLVILIVLNIGNDDFQNIWLYAVRNIYFLCWNVIGIILLVGEIKKSGVIRPEVVDPLRVVQSLRKTNEFLSSTIVKYEKSGLTRELALRDLERLKHIMRVEKPYLDSELSLPDLSMQLRIPRNRLSQILNEYIGASFNDFINSYRVEEAKRILLANDGSGNILRIAFDAGFNSKTTFYTIFRKATGMTPSEYQSSRETRVS
jgi:AraC-like DNA-binding protein